MTPHPIEIERERARQPDLRPDQWHRNARDRATILRRMKAERGYLGGMR